jgi:hypothetical protein
VSAIIDVEAGRGDIELKARPFLEGSRNEALAPHSERIVAIAKRLVVPNLTLNRQETDKRRQAVKRDIKPVIMKINKGESIVRYGETINNRHLGILGQMEKNEQNDNSRFQFFFTAVFLSLIIFSIVSFLEGGMSSFVLRWQDFATLCLLMVATILAIKGVQFIATEALIEKFLPKPLSRDRDQALIKAQDALLAFGITGIADMGTSLEDWSSFRRAGDAGWLNIRIFAYSAGLDPILVIGGNAPTAWLYGDRLRMGGVKLYSDGALGSRGAWLKAPYADSANNRGLQFVEDTKLRNIMSRAALDGYQIAIHAIGDAANAQALDAFAELQSTYKGDRRWRIEHAQIVDPADIPRFAQLGVIASMQPVHQTSDRTMAEARLGLGRLEGAYAWKSLKASGAHLAFGSDTPVESPDPFAGLVAAITREDAKGEPFGGWQPQERVSREEALAGFTTGAAYASFAEGKVGRLAPGLWADFILVDRDPMLATPGELRGTKVLETWVAGRKVYSRP